MGPYESAVNDIIGHGLERLDNGLEGTDSGDLHYHLFNKDHFIIGTFDAEQFLVGYGVFDAIGKVKDYEMENFGECNTDFSDPEKIANMLAYVVGEEALWGFEVPDGGKLAAKDIEAAREHLSAQINK